MADVDFFNEDINFKLPKPGKTRRWIKEVITREKKYLAHLNFIFCSDEYLLAINQQYLKHKTLTDIITFDNSEGNGAIEGDIFISIERVRANAEELKASFDEELHRVLIHGVLHLLGYSDKTLRNKGRMRKKEDAYLSLRSN
jgi:probable rRNA maturation factor